MCREATHNMLTCMSPHTGGKESSTDSQLQSGSASAALVRISFLRAWATISEASIIHPQLEPCVAERLEVLGALWLDTLLDLAEREVSDSRFADQQEGSSDTPASQVSRACWRFSVSLCPDVIVSDRYNGS